jgi:anaerobic carbon-monoxide dehydrogenase iron sulfur subunit
MRAVFINPERCIGCLQCEFACAVEHSHSRDPSLAFMEVPRPRKRVHVEAGPRAATAFPNRCRHCTPAPCQQVCPTAAIRRDPEHDQILIDDSKCIACAMCAMVCPFDVLTFYALTDGASGRVVAVKCDGCIDRLRHDRVPACVEACKVQALVFGDPNEIARAGRQRETATVLEATAMFPPAEPAIPAAVTAWRTLGEATATAGKAGGAR